MNKTKLTDTQYSAREKVEQQFAAWRETRTKRGRIPDSLWFAAVDLYYSYGLSINQLKFPINLPSTCYATMCSKVLTKDFRPVRVA
ncbi:hypothetical protein [uncultured Desulfobacter sp.]|uniref:hypothetical protein n=1 Tax=uncultured Desulfobacter sp. TaxID=240139 RepID=UPI002AAB19B9|nr:hypothetical protein [uncultured Desulfobacter sp.]